MLHVQFAPQRIGTKNNPAAQATLSMDTEFKQNLGIHRTQQNIPESCAHQKSQVVKIQTWMMGWQLSQMLSLMEP